MLGILPSALLLPRDARCRLLRVIYPYGPARPDKQLSGYESRTSVNSASVGNAPAAAQQFSKRLSFYHGRATAAPRRFIRQLEIIFPLEIFARLNRGRARRAVRGWPSTAVHVFPQLLFHVRSVLMDTFTPLSHFCVSQLTSA